MLKAEPVTLERSRRSVLDKVRSSDGRFAVYAYPNFDAADIIKGLEFMAETSPTPRRSAAPGEPVFVGETTVYALMYRHDAQRGPVRARASASADRHCWCWLQLRSLGQTLLTCCRSRSACCGWSA
jgi:hypothetical protein